MATSTVTNAYLAQLVQAESGLSVPDLAVASFKIGVGGWELTPSQTVKTPNPVLADLDIIENPSIYGRTPLDAYYFEKVIASDKIVTTDTTITIECFVDTSEGNGPDPYTLASPEFWEIGIFNAEGTMIAYSTFDKQTKDDRRALRHFITIQRTLG